MIGFMVRRVMSLIGVLFMLLVAVFIIRVIIPADPVRAMLGPAASDQAVAAERQALGLDKPLPQQFVSFVSNALHGDLGTSIQTRRPVWQDIVQFAPATIELVGCAMVLALVLALVLGLVGARSGLVSRLVRFVMISAASAPVFLVALALLVIFFLRLGWIPASGQASFGVTSPGPTNIMIIDFLLHGDLQGFNDAAAHLLMPAICLALAPAVAIGRVLRGSIVDVLEHPYIRTARVKGIREWQVLTGHALRNASGAALSMAGLQLGALLAGDVVVEQIFAWPGLGRYAANAVVYADFPAVTGVVLVFGFGYVVVNAIVDVLQMVLDPRLRDAGAGRGPRRATRIGGSVPEGTPDVGDSVLVSAPVDGTP